jgi:transposase InsO family protein
MKRTLVEMIIKEHHLSQRRAFKLVDLHRSVGRYITRKAEDNEERERIKSIALERPRFGYRRIHIVLQKTGIKINHKKLFRLYREMGLKVRRRARSVPRNVFPSKLTTSSFFSFRISIISIRVFSITSGESSEKTLSIV